MEFLQISLELYSVYIRENDSYINLIIHLLYHSDNVRPYMVKIDTINENELSSDIKQRLKPHFMKFKMSDLHTAFDEILSKDNSTFTWMQKDDTDESLLELNDTDSSDEENFLVQLQSKHKRSLRSLGKRELQKRNTRKKQKIDKNTKSSEDNSTDSQEIRYPKTKKAHTKSSQQISIKKNKAKKATFVLRQKKINKNSVETTSLHRSNNKIKLKQTKLNFQTRTDEVSNKNQTSSSKSKLSSKPDSKQSKISKLIASTPLHNRKYKVKNVPSSPTLEISNITSIEEKTANKLDYSKDRDELGKDSRKS
ncbi:PREDICTED: E3 ubiquitin-protein ligase BRE1-like [Cyphomyrmex costatus]|nr:PREDICTED: E3 ubiquitin-protein ligase BRE1-like [Cyphomyrmex costatus]